MIQAGRFVFKGLIMTDSSLEKAFGYAVRLLTKKDYSAYELSQKLRSRCRDEDEVNAVIERLQELRYQSDARCADMLVRHYVGNGYGKLRIFYEAKMKGISRELITSCLDEVGADWNGLARDVLLRRYEHPESLEYKERLKAVAFLVRRGFSQGEAVAGLKQAVSESLRNR